MSLITFRKQMLTILNFIELIEKAVPEREKGVTNGL